MAAGEGEGLSLGIDIEWMRPDRPFANLAKFLVRDVSDRLGPAQFYRTWTFYEAYFKALQRVPPEPDLHAVMRQTDSGGVQWLPGDTRLLQFCVAGEFQLSLVWRAPMPHIYAVHYFPIAGASPR
ncbi:MAG TPA: 4'-phosphopantetheinyl transferase superfamily protein [Rhizomicrobium sp.]|nr:4'-phosphopantetheinyl transferase superfamily protein [Rhizomicrobium sp.]